MAQQGREAGVGIGDRKGPAAHGSPLSPAERERRLTGGLTPRQLYPIRQLELNKQALKVTSDGKLSGAEKNARRHQA